MTAGLLAVLAGLAAAAVALAVLAALLARRARLLRAILEAAPECYVIWPSRTDAGRASPGLARALGLEPGQPATFAALLETLAAEDAARLDHAVGLLQDQGTPFELAVATAETRRRFLAHGAALPGRAGAAILWLRGAGALGAAAAGLEHERDWLRQTLDALPFPVWRRGPDLAIAYRNRAYVEAVGLDPDDAAAPLDAELVSGGSPARVRRLAEEARETGARASGELPFVVEGIRRVMAVTETPLPDSVETVGAAQDVTQADTAQRDLERHLKAQSGVMANLTVPIAILGADRRLKFFNDAYAAMWRLDPAWLRGEPTYGELLDAMREKRLLPELADFRAYKRKLLEEFAGATEPAEDVLHRPDGSTIRIAMTPHPLGGVVFTYEDVTSRLALERSLNTQLAVQRATIDNLFEGVAVFGSDGRLKLYNPGFARLWGLGDTAALADAHIADILEWTRRLYDDGGDWPAFKAGIIAQISERSPVSTRLERRDQTVLEAASVPLPDGATLMTYLDVTDGIHKQRALTERTEALEAADRLKSEFIANISYELRTPLNTIAGFAEILANQYFGALTERQAEYCRGILESTQHLMGIINDMLDLASIEAGQLSLDVEEFEIAPAMAAVAAIMQRRAKADRLQFAFDCPPDIGTVMGDQRRLKQVAFNLLSNAFKFTPSGGHIAFALRRDGTDVVLTVADTGIGITREDQLRVFEKFRRGRGASRYSGTGIGLSLVKSFVELHGGTVTLESQPNAGTRVVCRVPAAPRPADSASTEDAA